MMRRALVNLVVNAVHAAGRSGRVEVRASLSVRAQRPVVHISVGDSGPGIPSEVVPRVFEPFFTTKATGTGLGLAVVKSIIDSHSGEIELESTPGTGTKVSVFLPLAPEAGDGLATTNQRSAW